MGLFNSDPEKEANVWRILTAVFGLIAILAVIWAAMDQRENTRELIAEIRKRFEVEKQLDRTSAELERQRALAKVSPEAFLVEYGALLTKLRQAADAYAAAKRLPPSDRAGAVANAQRILLDAAATFNTFIVRWRAVSEALAKLSDGNAAEMARANDANDPDAVESAARRLIDAYPSLRGPLEVFLEQIKNSSR